MNIFYRLEFEILVQLTKAQVEVQNWRFLSTLMALYGAQTRMSAWERTLQSREVVLYVFFSSKFHRFYLFIHRVKIF